MSITDKEWQEFVEWCQKRFPLWMPHKQSIETWLEWEEEANNANQ